MLKSAQLLAPVYLVLIAGCAPSSPPSPLPPSEPPQSRPSAFTPGVEGRAADEVCNTASPACQQWTELAWRCEENMRARDAGDMSPQRPYCTEAETLREKITGIPLSSDPGAYAF